MHSCMHGRCMAWLAVCDCQVDRMRKTNDTLKATLETLLSAPNS